MGRWPAIRAIASYLPERAVTNDELAAEFADWDPQTAYAKTGVRSRRVVAPGECASDLAYQAAEKLLASADIGREAIDYLILCTQSPDYFLPTTACLLQHRLHLRTEVGAIDVNQGCSGFVYGLGLACGLIESGQARNVLLLTADTYTRFLNARDRSVRTVFGDGAAAVLVAPADGERRLIGPFVYGTDGTGAGNLIVPAGGLRTPRDAATEVERQDAYGNVRAASNLYMNGAEIMRFALLRVPDLVRRLAESTGDDGEVDFYIFHQASKLLLDQLRMRLKIPAPKFYAEISDVGNTVSATIPIALERALVSGQIRCGSRVLVAGFGVGYSWAGTIVTIHQAT